VVEIVQCRVGSDNFACLVVCPETGQTLAIDPGRDPGVLLTELQRRNLTLTLLANTHGHADHAAGNG
jgi:glyoxylase-like metal-dependent hydrolase (beta-lactamase superfamily II)